MVVGTDSDFDYSPVAVDRMMRLKNSIANARQLLYHLELLILYCAQNQNALTLLRLLYTQHF